MVETLNICMCFCLNMIKFKSGQMNTSKIGKKKSDIGSFRSNTPMQVFTVYSASKPHTVEWFLRCALSLPETTGDRSYQPASAANGKLDFIFKHMNLSQGPCRPGRGLVWLVSSSHPPMRPAARLSLGLRNRPWVSASIPSPGPLEHY